MLELVHRGRLPIVTRTTDVFYALGRPLYTVIPLLPPEIETWVDRIVSACSQRVPGAAPIVLAADWRTESVHWFILALVKRRLRAPVALNAPQCPSLDPTAQLLTGNREDWARLQQTPDFELQASDPALAEQQFQQHCCLLREICRSASDQLRAVLWIAALGCDLQRNMFPGSVPEPFLPVWDERCSETGWYTPPNPWLLRRVLLQMVTEHVTECPDVTRLISMLESETCVADRALLNRRLHWNAFLCNMGAGR